MHGKRHEGEDTARKIHIHETHPAHDDAGEGVVAPAEHEAGNVGVVPDSEAVVAELEKVRAEANASHDKYLRLYAETENYKKRMARDSAEREKYYNEGIIKEMLPVMDNLERAIAHAGGDGEPGGLMDGVRMVKKQLMDALAKYGVTEVQSVGLPFDPERQQAVMQVETEDYDDGVVVDELQKGYFLNERILRPAMVTVAKRPKDAGVE